MRRPVFLADTQSVVQKPEGCAYKWVLTPNRNREKETQARSRLVWLRPSEMIVDTPEEFSGHLATRPIVHLSINLEYRECYYVQHPIKIVPYVKIHHKGSYVVFENSDKLPIVDRYGHKGWRKIPPSLYVKAMMAANDEFIWDDVLDNNYLGWFSYDNKTHIEKNISSELYDLKFCEFDRCYVVNVSLSSDKIGLADLPNNWWFALSGEWGDEGYPTKAVSTKSKFKGRRERQQACLDYSREEELIRNGYRKLSLTEFATRWGASEERVRWELVRESVSPEDATSRIAKHAFRQPDGRWTILVPPDAM